MRKQLVIIGITTLLVCAGLSGCNQISNLFLNDEEKLVGTWNTEGIWMDLPSVIEFSSNNTFRIEVKFGAINFSLSNGKWTIKEGILTMEMTDAIPLTNYTYQFSDDSRTFKITDIASNDSYVLRKQ
jgi:hypothetical protein